MLISGFYDELNGFYVSLMCIGCIFSSDYLFNIVWYF